MKNKAIINARIYDYDKYIENGFVVFSDKIIKVGSMSDFVNEDYQIIDLKGKLLLPNFVCAHSHIYSIFARGLSLPFNPNNFVEILEQMWWKIDSKIDNEITYYSGIAASYEFLLNGVTTVFDHHASGKDIIGSLNSLKKSINNVCGLHSLLCFETSDRYNVNECIKENHKFYVNNKNRIGVGGLFGLHASMTLSDKTLSKIKKIIGDEPLHVHVAESKMDEDDSLSKYNVNIISRFNNFDLLKEDSLIVHGVSLSDEELSLIKEKKCYLVVNTTSNMNNAVGLPDVTKYIKYNIPVMVGNDGLTSNVALDYLNVYYSSHLRNSSPTKLNLNDILKMINNSFEYANKRLNIKIGKFEKDYLSDFMIVDYSPFTNVDKNNIFGHIFYGLFPSFRPMNVYLGGKLKVKNYQICDKKILKEYAKCKTVSMKLWNSLLEEK